MRIILKIAHINNLEGGDFIKLKNISFKTKLISLFVIFVLILVMTFSISLSIKKNKEIKRELIYHQLLNIKELVTVKYNYSHIISLKENYKFNDLVIPFTEKSIILKYDGYIKAGVVLDKSKIVLKGDKLILTLPNSVILDHVVNEDDISILDERTSIFNPIQSKDVFEEILQCKKEREEELIKNGFLDEVNVTTEKFLKDFFNELDYEVIVEFK